MFLDTTTTIIHTLIVGTPAEPSSNKEINMSIIFNGYIGYVYNQQEAEILQKKLNYIRQNAEETIKWCDKIIIKIKGEKDE